jgi:cell shape-determining protein MreC
MKIRARRPSKFFTFGILMLLAAILSVLPAAWSGWLRGPFQLLGLPQQVLLSAARRLVADASVSSEQVHSLERQNQELQRLVAQQALWLSDLNRRLEELSGLREQLWADRADIVVCPVIGYDSVPRRQTLLIGHGAEAQIEPGQWVAGGVAYEGRDRAEDGRRLVMRGFLIGRVSEVQTYSSRVQLATDPKFAIPVVVARVLPDGTWQPDTQSYLLNGAGDGGMMIWQADRDLVALGYGVVLVPASPELPATLSIGRIKSSAPSGRSALHYDVRVEPWAQVQTLRHVYVIRVRR